MNSMAAPRDHWIYHLSDSQLIVLTVLVGLGLFGLSCGLDILWSWYNGTTLVAMVAADALVSSLCAFLLLQLILAWRAHHRKLMLQLEVVADMNHHIRNALETIQLTTYSSDDQKLVADVLAATERIAWALREVLPKSTSPEK